MDMKTSHYPSSRNRLTKGAALALAAMLLMPLASSSADARLGGGFSFGSRGTRTFSAPPATMTAPRPAFPIQRTETPNFGAQAPSFGQPRRFGFGSGLAAGLLGAGLFGMLSGNGFFGGIGGFGSLFGFLLQIALIGLLVRFALNYFRTRNVGAAYAGAPNQAPRSSFGGLGAGLGSAGFVRPGAREALQVSQNDFATFERVLSDIQYAYGREDLQAMSRLATPEMLRHLGADIEVNKSRGLRNELSDIRLVQGDLSEAWREGPADYATVAMRFAARDTMVERATGRVVSGDASALVEATELWTFRRERGGHWLLSAVQQTR